MNWKYIYTTATPEEQTQLTCLLLKQIARRDNRLIFANQLWKVGMSKLVKRCHYVGSEKTTYLLTPYANYLLGFAIAVASITVILLMGTDQMSTAYGALLLIAFEMILISTLVIKPWRRWRPAY